METFKIIMQSSAVDISKLPKNTLNSIKKNIEIRTDDKEALKLFNRRLNTPQTAKPTSANTSVNDSKKHQFFKEEKPDLSEKKSADSKKNLSKPRPKF